MIVNSYATLSDFKNYLSVRGQSTNMNTDAVDDVQIAEILEAVSRYVDDRTHRTFYPRYETRYVSVPEGQNNLRTLYLDDDLLAAVTVTNGDTEVVASTEYNLLSKNYNPKWGIQILQTANVGWNATVAGSPDYSISILGWWGFHNQYSQRGWSVLDTLAVADTTATGLTFTVTTGTTLLANQLINGNRKPEGRQRLNRCHTFNSCPYLCLEHTTRNQGSCKVYCTVDLLVTLRTNLRGESHYYQRRDCYST
jgi:hypothetical protein